MLLVLVFNAFLKALNQPRFYLLCCSLLWIENLQQLLGGIVQSIVIISKIRALWSHFADCTWTCYWLWRIGRDIVGKGGWVAACFIALSFLVDVALLFMLQARLS